MEIVKLGDVFSISSSRRVLKSQWKESGVPFYRGREITRLSKTCNAENELFISDELYSDLSSKGGIPSEGDILITAIGTVGNTYIVKPGDKFYFKDASVLWLKKKEDVDSRYINMWLKSPMFFDQLEDNGTTVNTLTITKLQSLRISLPPIEEQRRVVERLDAAFEKIDRAIELTEKNIKNSWHLFDAFHKEKFEGGGITKKLGEVLVLQRGYDLPKSQRVLGAHPLVSSSGIIDNISEYRVRGPGICTGRSGSVGATFYVENDFWPLNTTLYVKDFLGNDPRYCYWLLYGLDLKQFAGGTGVPTLNRNIVHEHMVKMSQGESQKEIANTLDTEYLLCQDLSTKYQKKLSSLKSFKQSLLTQAFSQSEVK